jgi:small subunit ribosomal protein S14
MPGLVGRIQVSVQELSQGISDMAKKSVLERQDKREKLVAKFAKKYGELKAVSNDAKRTDEERYMARLELQKMPRNANPTRLRNRCALTGRGRGTFKMFGLGRNKIRELAFKGDIPGMVKASW